MRIQVGATNKMNKFPVAVIKSKKKIVRHLSLGKTGHFPKSIFYFLRCKYNDCKVNIAYGKAVNLGDGMRVRVSCILLFRGQIDFIDILRNELSKNM